jgi:hypothetical protein
VNEKERVGDYREEEAFIKNPFYIHFDHYADIPEQDIMNQGVIDV